MSFAEWFQFALKVLPQAYKLGRDIYKATGNDHTEAIRNIEDRRAEIAENQRLIDEALKKKYQ